MTLNMATFYLPDLAVGADQSGIVHCRAHHGGHARCTVEKVEERLLCNVI